MTKSIYSNFFTTKIGSKIPILQNGKSIESKYNPEREAESLLEQYNEKFDFFILIGIGSGIFLTKLSEKFPNTKILAIEYSKNDIDFISELETIKKCLKNKNIIFSDLKNLKTTILNNYIPAIYGNANIIFQRIWALENPIFQQEIKNEIQSALNLITQDYSVQSHFGKIWQKNIIENLLCLSKLKKKECINADSKKIALVIAAGPSLDKNLEIIKKTPEKFYIISTDTAYEILSKHKICPDIVVSIDGQNISTNHFFCKINYSKTNFIFDLCANSCITKKLSKHSDKIFFFSNGHPFSEYAKQFSNSIKSFFTGSGTVTIAALDIAFKLNFKQIFILGADFGYINNKPYAKGTYLDNIFSKDSSFIDSIEKKFTNLMFRTELKKINSQKATTSVLENYKISLENFLYEQNANFIIENDIYKINKNENTKTVLIKNEKFDFTQFIKNLNSKDFSEQNIFLPYIAHLRTKKEYKNFNFEQLVKLAHYSIVRYNKMS